MLHQSKTILSILFFLSIRQRLFLCSPRETGGLCSPTQP